MLLIIRSKPDVFWFSDFLIFFLSVSGSVYEISGSEVCFSTGDLIKVIGMEMQSVCCEDVENNETFELPINHTGLFQEIKQIVVREANSLLHSSPTLTLSLRPI